MSTSFYKFPEWRGYRLFVGGIEVGHIDREFLGTGTWFVGYLGDVELARVRPHEVGELRALLYEAYLAGNGYCPF